MSQSEALLEEGKIFLGKSRAGAECLELKLANRHGLVTGATGTGKTVSLQVMTTQPTWRGACTLCSRWALEVTNSLIPCRLFLSPRGEKKGRGGAHPQIASGLSRSTGLPLPMCSSKIAGTSASFTCVYQVPVGYTTIVGPCSHGPKQLELVIRTWPGWILRSINPMLSAIRMPGDPAAPQDGLGCPGGREFVQTTI